VVRKIPQPSCLGGLEGLRGARRGPQHSPKKDALRLPAEPQRPGGSEMTAEVAILNKIGVALAADSIVTITTANGDKTYNTANKLFALSKYHPIGILIWNSTDFSTIPLEVIIKEFRTQLGRKSYATVADYSNAFMRYLKTRAPISAADQKETFRRIMHDFCLAVRSEFIEECRQNKIPITQPLITGASRTRFTEMLDGFELN
jgi:hypothetical protein